MSAEKQGRCFLCGKTSFMTLDPDKDKRPAFKCTTCGARNMPERIIKEHYKKEIDHG